MNIPLDDAIETVYLEVLESPRAVPWYIGEIDLTDCYRNAKLRLP